MLTSSAWDASIRSWDPATGAHLKTITGHTDAVASVTFSPDGTTLATRSWDKTIRLWDATTGQLRHTLIGHQDDVDVVVFGPDGRTLASGSQDDTVRLWDAVTGEHIKTLRGHHSYLISLAFSPDGSILASGSEDDSIRLWDAVTGGHITTLREHEAGVETLAFSPDGGMLASGSRDNTIRLWDVETHEVLHTITEHEDDVWTVAFSPDGKTLASGGGDTVSLWDVTTAERQQTFVKPIDPETVVEDPEASEGDAPAENPANATSLVFSPDGAILVSGSYDATIRLWDIGTGEQLETLQGHTYSITSVAVSPDGSTIASGSFDGTVLLWAFPIIPDLGASISEVLGDLNQDGIINIQDIVLIAGSFGADIQTNSEADLNGDGEVNIQDLVIIANALGNAAAAPSTHVYASEQLTAAQIEQWLRLAKREASQLNHTSKLPSGISYARGILILKQILETLAPRTTALFPNYPNPFNPETWIPYQLAEPANVTITIYAVNGQIVRRLELGHQIAGTYQSKSRAAYWDGRNAVGEAVANGIYFYMLTADGFTATRKMLILK